MRPPKRSSAISTTFFPATVTTQSLPSLSETAIRVPSGDQAGAESIEPKVVVSCSAFAEPSCGTSQSCSSPERSETKRTVFPSGDQAACLSWAFEECVRFRVGPFSIGAVKTSPRATKRTRSPFGERL